MDWTADSETSPRIGEDLISHEKLIGIPVYPGLECAGFIPAGAVPAGGGDSLPIVSGTTDDSVDSVVDFFNEKLPGWHYHERHIRYFTKEEGCDIARPEMNARVHVRVHPPAGEGQPVVVQYFYKE